MINDYLTLQGNMLFFFLGSIVLSFVFVALRLFVIDKISANIEIIIKKINNKILIITMFVLTMITLILFFCMVIAITFFVFMMSHIIAYVLWENAIFNYILFLLSALYYYFVLGNANIFVVQEEEAKGSFWYFYKKTLNDYTSKNIIQPFVKILTALIYTICLILGQLVELKIIINNGSTFFQFVNYSKYAIIIIVAVEKMIEAYKKDKEKIAMLFNKKNKK